MTPALAIEVSSPRGSLALLHGGEIIAERSWEEDRFRNQRLFKELSDLLAGQDLGLNAVGAFMVGRGPGAFSSLRIAISLARSAALPGAREVYAVSSGEALAFEMLSETDVDRVAVVGDARRGSLWIGLFERGTHVRPTPWSLCAPEDFLQQVPDDALVVTSCRDRLRDLLAPEVFKRRLWAPGNRYPAAGLLGRLARIKLEEGCPSEPLTPLYMHPPVQAKRKYGDP